MTCETCKSDVVMWMCVGINPICREHVIHNNNSTGLHVIVDLR